MDRVEILNGKVTLEGANIGGGIRILNAILEVIESTISGNTAGAGTDMFGDGGGIGTDNDARVILTNVTVLGNRALQDGGGIELETGRMTITDCTISGNTAASQDGGGIENDRGRLMVVRSTISNNTSGDVGGGIRNDRGTLTVINSTIAFNRAIPPGEGIGGGIENREGGSRLAVINSTIFGNIAETGGGISNHESKSMATLTNTIVARNTPANSSGMGITSNGYNLDDDGSFGLTATGDLSNIDPLLDPNGLKDNGGPTKTIALLPGSMAIDKGKAGIDPTTGQPTIVDQRGLRRPFDFSSIQNAGGGDGSDIGAFELQPVCAPVSFGPAVNFAAGDNPTAMASGDFNVDGDPDLAVLNTLSADVSVLLGDGQGGFNTLAGLPLGAVAPSSLEVADFDVDGFPDLAVANRAPFTVIILKGDGQGGFTIFAGSPIAVGAQPESLAVGDFDLDGKVDLAVANAASDDVTILKGDGQGGFSQVGSPVGAGNGPVSLAVGDFNRDFIPDLAVATDRDLAPGDPGIVMILLGDGRGGFSQAEGSPVDAGRGPISVVVGDLNRDGNPDLATANIGSADVTILLGDGQGGFTQAEGSPVSTEGRQPVSIAVSDFNGDAKPDLAVANNGRNQFPTFANAAVLLGDGQGGFSQAEGSPVEMGNGPISVVVGNFNGDGNPDLAVANIGSDNVTIRLNVTAKDVTTQVRVTRSGFVRNRSNGHFFQRVTLQNISGSPISGPVFIELESLSRNATLVEKAGVITYVQPFGAPCSTIVFTGPDNVFNPQESASVVLEFSNPTNTGITYTTFVFAGSGMP